MQADAKCELCKFVVRLLDETLANGGSIAKLNETLIGICDNIPDQYKGIVSVVDLI